MMTKATTMHQERRMINIDFKCIVIFVLGLGMIFENFTMLRCDRFLSTISSSSAPVPAARAAVSQAQSFQSIVQKHSQKVLSVKCGDTKCFVIFSLNNTANPNPPSPNVVGYIVAQENRTWRGDFELGFNKSYEIANKIRHRYPTASTLLIGPSETIRMNTTTTTELLFVNQFNDIMKEQNPPSKAFEFSTDVPWIVQKSLVIPSPNIFWHYKSGLAGHSNRNNMKQLSTYLEFIELHVQDLEMFAKNVSEQIGTTRQIVKAFPCLTMDFQFLLDYEGKIHHLDLDRCFDESSSKRSHIGPPLIHPVEDIIEFLNTLEKYYTMAIEEVKLISK